VGIGELSYLIIVINYLTLQEMPPLKSIPKGSPSKVKSKR